jgi:hypothetical protein
MMRRSVCPEWYVPSSPLLGRCIPFFNKLTNGSTISNSSILFPDGEVQYLKKIKILLI